MLAAPDHPQLLITARVSMPRLCLLPWHHAHSPPGAHGPPSPPASPLFCKPLCKIGGPTGTGWHRLGTQCLDSPHPTCKHRGAQVPGWGAPPATFSSLLSVGVSRVVPHSMGAVPVLPLPCPPTHPGKEGSGGPSLQHQQVLGVSSLPRGCCSSSSSRARVGARGGPRSSSSSLRCACSTSSVSRVKDCGRGVG